MEIVCTLTRTEGSNPSLSAILIKNGQALRNVEVMKPVRSGRKQR